MRHTARWLICGLILTVGMGCEGPSGGDGYVVEHGDGSGEAATSIEFGGDRRDTTPFEGAEAD